DVIKLLPPLTLSESEAQSCLDALDAVLADCERAPAKNWAVVRDIASATLRRRRTEQDSPADDWTPFRGKQLDRTRDDVCLITGATGFIGGRLARRLAQEGTPVRCLAREGSDVSPLEQLDVEIAVGDLTSPR